MKNRTWHILVSLLLVLLVGAAAFCGFAFYRISKAADSIAKDYAGSFTLTGSEVTISDSTEMSDFYTTLFNQMQQYGNMEQTEEAFSALATQIFVKTMKDCTVDSVDFEENAVIVNVHGVAVPLEELNEKLLIASAGKAAWQYLSSDLLGAASSILQGTDAIKEQLYGRYANEFLTTLKDDIMNKQVVPVYYKLTFRLENGQWIMQLSEQSHGDAANADNTETVSSVQESQPASGS